MLCSAPKFSCDAVDSPRASERGFALTEVLIAAVLLVLVSAAFLQLVVGSTQAQSSLRVQQRQQSVTESVLEKLRADTTWTDACKTGEPLPANSGVDIVGAKTATCTVTFNKKFDGATFTKDARSGEKFDVSVTGTSVDSNGDLQGANDADKNIYDFFIIKTVITAPAAYKLQPLKSTSVIDPTSTSSAGAVDISICRLPEQSDERVTITSCPAPASPLAPGALMSDDGVTDVLNRADYADNAAMLAAYNAIPVAQRSVKVLPMAGLSLTLQGVGKSAGKDYSVVTGPDGRIDQANIKPGRYKIVGVPIPNNMELWEEQSIPEMTINVMPFQIATGAVVQRAKAIPTYKIRTERFDSKTSAFTLGVPRTVRIKLVPMPLNRAPIADGFAEYGMYDGFKEITQVMFKDVRPGLYSPYVVNSSGGLERLQHYVNGNRSPLSRIWISSAGGTTLPTTPTGVAGTDDTTQPVASPENSGTYVTNVFHEPEWQPEVYTHDAIPTVPDCSYRTPNQLYESNLIIAGAQSIQFEPNSTLYTQIDFLGFPIWPGGMTEGNDRFGGRYYEIDATKKRYYMPSYETIEWFRWVDKNFRNCDQKCPRADIQVKQEALNSDVNIFCDAQSTCKQHITVDNGDKSPFGLLRNWFSAKGGEVNIYCLGNANCEQTGSVIGSGQSNFFCYSGSNCKQTFVDPSHFFSDDRGGYVEKAECYGAASGNRAAARCNQTVPLPQRTVANAFCYPESKCTQSIDDDMSWSENGNDGILVECHRDARCSQTLTPVLSLNLNGMANFFNWLTTLFGGNRQGEINMLCGTNSTCTQTAKLGKVDNGFAGLCARNSTCKQNLYNATTLNFAFTRSAMAQQNCWERATCDQTLVRTVATGQYNSKDTGMRQACYTPPTKGQPIAANAEGPACNMTAFGRRFFFGIFQFLRDSRQHCETAATCNQTLQQGGFGTLAWFRYDDYTQYCASKSDCTQFLNRPADLLSNVKNVYQMCETSTGKCDQSLYVGDDTVYNRNGWRRQMCDSRTSCKQYMASFRKEDNPFTDNAFVNFFRGINSAINSMFSSMMNHKNPVWQTCNIPITEDPEGIIIDPQPGGSMNTTTDGKGGA